MRRQHVHRIAILMVGVLFFSGCLWAPGLERLKREIESQIPEASFDKEISLTLGPVSLGLVRMFTRFIPEAREARGYLKDIRKVELAVYETESLPSLDDLRFPKQLKRLTEEEGWQIAAKIREEHEVIWILYLEHMDRIDSIYVVVLDDDNLVLARIKGNLERIVRRGLEEAEILKDT